MNINKETQGANTIIELELNNSVTVDSLALGMITNNTIKGIASATCTQIDNVKHLRYVVDSKICLSQLIQNPVNKRTLLGVFSNILKVLISAEDYMLDSKTLLVDKEYIFVDPATCSVSMICVPVMNSDTAYSLYDFFKNIVFSVQIDFSESSEYIARLINYFNSKTDLDRIEFASFVVGLLNSDSCVPTIDCVTVGQSAVSQQPAYQSAAPQQPAYQSVAPQQPAYQTAAPQQPAYQSAAPQQPAYQSAAPQQPAYQSAVSQQPTYQPDTPQQSVYRQDTSSEVKQPKSATVNPVNIPTGNINKSGVAIPTASKNNTVNIPGKQTGNVADTEKSDKKQKKKSFSLFGSKKTEENKKENKATNNNPSQKFAIPGQVIVNNKGENKQNVATNSASRTGLNETYIGAQQPHTYFPHTQQVAGNFGETTVLGVAKAGETTVLGMAGETTVLSSVTQTKPQPYLIREKNKDNIHINKPRYRIGKEKSYVDYFIGDNTAISRSHADIIVRDDGCYIVDLNSTNHTFVNGTMIQSGAEVKIENGMIIRLANENFEFKYI